MDKITFLITAFILFSMTNIIGQENIDWQGHRGCRGLMPENTIPAFLKAVDLKVTTLELDVVISKDGNVVISHEPWMSEVICSHPDGAPVTKDEALNLKLFQMTSEEISTFDCGLRGHPRFPDQQKLAVHKPTLREAVMEVKRYCAEKNVETPKYNIEIKSSLKGYGILVPQPKVFVDLVVAEIRRLAIEDITSLQSFDVNAIEELNKIDNRKFEIAYLVGRVRGIKKNMKNLTFVPEIYSPNYKLLSKSSIKKAQKLGMKVIPWTVNEPKAMQKLIRKGVDGIITDYPNLIANLLY